MTTEPSSRPPGERARPASSQPQAIGRMVAGGLSLTATFGMVTVMALAQPPKKTAVDAAAPDVLAQPSDTVSVPAASEAGASTSTTAPPASPAGEEPSTTVEQVVTTTTARPPSSSAPRKAPKPTAPAASPVASPSGRPAVTSPPVNRAPAPVVTAPPAPVATAPPAPKPTTAPVTTTRPS